MSAALKSLGALPVRQGSRVLLRVDYNVPLQDGAVADDARIRASLPTLQYLLNRGAVVVVLSHLGRPRGGADPALSLRPVADRLGQLVDAPVAFVDDTVGEAARRAVREAPPASVVVLENVRFHPEETQNADQFAAALASLGDLFVNDAFGTAHRAHATTVGLPSRLPSAAGLLMEREIRALQNLRSGPRRPYWAIIGGAKVADKLGLLSSLARQVDGLVIGGGMANTFLAATGVGVGASRVEVEQIGAAQALLKEAAGRIFLPADVVVAAAFRSDAPHRVASVEDIAPGEWAVDIGPATAREMEMRLADAATVFWNGPLGVFEWPPFAEGTMAVARMLADCRADVVIGGGDSGAAVEKAGVRDKFRHVSTGGGAALAYLEGQTLPGVAALIAKGA